MSFMDRFFKRKLQPSVATSIVRNRPGPLTAHEAWAYALKEALSLDPEAKLLLIMSGTDIRQDGRSFVWEFLFHLERREARVLLSYGPPSDADEIENSPIVVVKRVTKATDRSRMVLPLNFRNSPDVVEEFSRNGADFVSGPTDMKLEANISPEGEPIWVTYLRDGEISARFTQSAD